MASTFPRAHNVARHGLDDTTLRNLYLDQRLSIDEIAALHQRSSSTIRRLLHRSGIPLRAALPDLSEAALRAMYDQQRLSIGEVAAHLGVDPQTVGRRLDLYQIPRHSARRTPWPGPALLAELYADQSLGIEQIADRLGRSPQWISSLLDRYGIPRRPAPEPVAKRIPKQDLADLYLDQGLTAAAVAARLGYSERSVIAALRYHRLGPRPSGSAGRLNPLDPKPVIDLYLDHRLSQDAIAIQLRTSPKRVHEVLKEHKIVRRTIHDRNQMKQIDSDVLADLYVQRRLSHPDIAARYAVPIHQVRQRLQELHITRPPARPTPMPSPPVEELEDRYLRQKQPFTTIGRSYGVAARTARRWIREAGIPVRPRTTRGSRQQLPVSEIRTLYVDQELTAAEVADILGTGTTNKVLRTLHDNALPVRNSGGRPAENDRSEHIRLLGLLYADPDILATLDAHGIARQPKLGPLATRFPTPTPLTPALLEQLYQTIGLSAYHIELLTGQPAEQILDSLHATGIPVRTMQGSSPWRRRQRRRPL